MRLLKSTVTAPKHYLPHHDLRPAAGECGELRQRAAAISTVLKVNLPVAAFITAIVSTFYFAFGGMKGVAWVTVLHSALKYFGILAIMGFALSKTGGFTPMIENMPDFYWTGMATSARRPFSRGLSAPLAPSSAPSL